MSHLTSEQIDELRSALEKERADLQTELSERGDKEPDGVWDASSSGLKGEEADPSDAADQIEELITNVPVVQELSARSHDIDNALLKMNNGTYGVCEVGNEEIPFERLQANPAARTCLTHA